MSRQLLAAAIATAVTTLSSTAGAQDQLGARTIEEIEVTSTSRRSQGLGEVNAAVSVVGEAELDLVDHMHYQQVLNRVPGVNIHRNNGQESLIAIRSPVLTGAGACGAFLVAENGIPVRSHGFCNVNEMFDTHSENARRIEVIRGPGSAFWGSNAVHGMINVVLPEPGDVARLTLEAGPRNTYRAKGQFGVDYGNFKHTVLVNGVSEDGRRAPSGVDQQKLTWLYNYTTDGGVQMDGGFTHINLNQETAGFVEGARAYAIDGLRDSNPNPEAFRDSTNGRAWTSFSWTAGGWDMVATPYWREVNMKFLQHFLPGQPTEDFYHRSLGAQFAAYRDVNGRARLALGLDGEATEGNLLQHQANPTQGSAFLRNTIPQGRHYDFEVDAGQLGAFVNYEHDLSDRLELSLGLRLERVDYSYDNKMIDGRTDEFGVPCGFGGCRYNRPADRDDDFTNLSPKIGLSYAINEQHTLQARALRGFRAPQATELYRLQNAQTVADLDSVELDSYELALNGAGQGWDYTASLYYMNKENEITTDSSRANLNGVHTRHKGLELAAGLDLTDTLALRGVINFTRHSYENSIISGDIDIRGNNVDAAPETFGTLRLAWQPIPALLTELEWVNMGDYFTNPENTASYEGHDLFNLRARYQFSEAVEFSLNVLNLSDERYAERADWTTFGGDRYFPGEPLRAFFGMTWQWR